VRVEERRAAGAERGRRERADMKNRKAWRLILVLGSLLLVGSGVSLHRIYEFRLMPVVSGSVHYGEIRSRNGTQAYYVDLALLAVLWSRRAR
jgi:hypothetical protein